MGSSAECPEPQDVFQYEPDAEGEGEGWGSDGHAEICTSNLAGGKKKKKRKKRSAVYVTIVYVAVLLIKPRAAEQ